MSADWKRTRTILVVEDEEDLALLLEIGLSSHGYSIVTANNCRTAREAAAHTTFDAIVTDLSLPDGSGADLIDAFTPRPRAVVVVSGFPHDANAAKQAVARADAYLLKPVDIADLAKKLRALLGSPDTSALSA